MEQYRKNLRIRIALFGILILFCLVIILINQFSTVPTYTESLALSFQRGFSTAGMLVLVFWMMKYRAALRDEAKLRLLYNEENDERMKAIRAKAGVPMVLILSLTLVLAGMIIGYWNETVFVVLICVALFQLLASLGVKLYYRGKM